jgi:hypothetical protein
LGGFRGIDASLMFSNGYLDGKLRAKQATFKWLLESLDSLYVDPRLKRPNSQPGLRLSLGSGCYRKTKWPPTASLRTHPDR